VRGRVILKSCCAGCERERLTQVVQRHRQTRGMAAPPLDSPQRGAVLSVQRVDRLVKRGAARAALPLVHLGARAGGMAEHVYAVMSAGHCARLDVWRALC